MDILEGPKCDPRDLPEKVKNISTIQTPPIERKPINTVIANHDKNLILSYILKEISRKSFTNITIEISDFENFNNLSDILYKLNNGLYIKNFEEQLIFQNNYLSDMQTKYDFKVEFRAK